MAIISCPECGKQVSDRAVSCPECGCPINAAPVVAAPQVDTAKEVEKLIVLARRAREASDSRNAKKYYDQILDKVPDNWEAIFYSVYYEAIECKIMYISSAANSVANCIYSTFSAIADLTDEAEQDAALDTVIQSACASALMFVSGAVNHYNQFSTTNGAYSECSSRVVSAGNIFGEIESGLKKLFPEKKKRLADFQMGYISFVKNNEKWYDFNYRNNTYARLDNEIGSFYPEHLKKRELEQKISNLNTQINSLVTVRTAQSSCLGYFFLPIGIFMIIMGFVLTSLDGSVWPFFVAIPEIIIGALCLIKKPSQEEVDANIVKKAQLTKERDELQAELDALN